MLIIKRDFTYDPETSGIDACDGILSEVYEWIKNDPALATVKNDVFSLLFTGVGAKNEKIIYPRWKDPSMIIGYEINNDNLLIYVEHLDRNALIQDILAEDLALGESFEQNIKEKESVVI